VAAARRFVGDTLRGWQRSDLADVVRLLASELVTNAVVHARTEVEVRVVLLDDAVRIEVCDGEPTRPVVHTPALDVDAGRGLVIVTDLAYRWGVIPMERGKAVWAEVRAPPLEAAAIGPPAEYGCD
jgi:hypothetical protein